MDLLTKLLINKYKNQGGGSGGSEMNLFIQNDQPEGYNGIWIKSNSFTYENIVETSGNTMASSINFITGSKYKTIMYSGVQNGLLYGFDKVILTDAQNEIDYDTEVYYGNGVAWVNITPLPFTAGLSVDFISGITQRLNDSASWSAGDDFNNLSCYQRRRCNLTDNGVVTAYYGDDNYTETGFAQSTFTAPNGDIISTGTPLQVMVEQPKVYYKVEATQVNNGILEKANYYVSNKKGNGFKTHPAFIRNNVEYDKIYISAYECTLYDTSTNTYTGQNTTTVDLQNDKISSIKGNSLQPRYDMTRAEFRSIAQNRGANWSILTIQAQALEQLLLIIEYATFNLQKSSALGKGNTGGSRKNLGSASSLNSNGTSAYSNNYVSFSWRWAENTYGDLAKMLDGANVDSGKIYITDHNFEENKITDNYEDSGLQYGGTSGNYITKFGYSSNFDWLFIPAECDLSIGTTDWDTGLIGDRCYYNSNTNAHIEIGGRFDYYNIAGEFCTNGSVGYEDKSSYVTTRCVYMG